MQGSNLIRDFAWKDKTSALAKQKSFKKYEPEEPIAVLRFQGTLKPLFPAQSDSQQLYTKWPRVIFHDNISGDFRPFKVY